MPTNMWQCGGSLARGTCKNRRLYHPLAAVSMDTGCRQPSAKKAGKQDRPVYLPRHWLREVNHPGGVRAFPAPIEAKEAAKSVLFARDGRRHLSGQSDLACTRHAEGENRAFHWISGREPAPLVFSSFKMAAAGVARRSFQAFIARIPWTMGAHEIKQYFSQFGTVKNCILPFNTETGFHKGFCWVGFSTEEGLKNALQKDSHIIEGAKLQVELQRGRHKPNEHSE
uniref:RRM domain-containing protein n=1 Tax=Varanus komodoensis TaxID=61221 RepID=A0A8D2LP05_VARKO